MAATDPVSARTRALAVVHRRFDGDVAALRGVTLELARGELTAVVGASGAGKTTLLRALAGQVRPTAGTVLIVGDRPRPGATPMPPVALLLDADQALRPPSRRWFWPPTRAQARAATTTAAGAGPAGLARLRLGHVAGRPPATLSTGERRRLAFLTELAAADAAVVLVDDPTRGLDPASAALVVAELLAVARAGRCVALTTTDPAVAALVDRAITLAEGRVVDDRRSSGRTIQDRPVGVPDGQDGRRQDA